MSDPKALLTFNGINGATGNYALPPTTVEEFAKNILLVRTPSAVDAAAQEELQARARQDKEGHLGLAEGLNPKKLEEAGWGVIFAQDADPEIYAAVSPLLQMRKQQAGARYKEFLGPVDGYKAATANAPAETKQNFLSRHKMGPGPANPEVVPYYLLIVGDPETIPFRFQYQLDVQYAVGRIHFDTPAEYANYANSVVASESGKLALAHRAAIFATKNPGDGSTLLSHDRLAVPLVAWANDQPGWTIDSYLDLAADKPRLARLLGDEAPAFLFTASHGLEFDNGDARQRAHQGALICQEYPGPSFSGEVPESFFFSGDDLAADAHIFGSIAMHFACFGGGTPQLSDYSHDVDGPPAAIAPNNFLGWLPQRMLAHPRGGALAVIAHVERAWPDAFNWDNAGSQTTVFTSTIQRLMEGHPVGSAMEYMNGRYAELASDLNSTIDDALPGTPDPDLLAAEWMACNDARGFAVMGDPAVRLWLVSDEKPVHRPVLELLAVPTTPIQPSNQIVVAPSTTLSTDQQEGPPVAYGVVSDSAKAIVGSLQDAAQKIGASLVAALQAVTNVEVRTYVSEDMDNISYSNGAFTGAKLRAVTLSSIDGNTQACVPQDAGKIDDALWKIHSDLCEKALANRVEMIKAAATAIGSLVPGVKLP